MSLPYFFSLIFFIVFAVCFLWGIYILSLNMKSMLNCTFFAVCLSLCVWAFSYSVANSSPDYEMTLFWRRISSLGWGTVYSFLLHFFLILTERSKILKKRLLYILLYLPGAITVFVFGLYRNLAMGQYNLVNTTAGWVNVSVNNWWDWYFNLYYAGFTIVGICLLWGWGKRSKDSQKKKQAYMLIASFAIAMLLGTFTDIIVNKYMSFHVPQLGPVMALIPIIAIFYAIKRHGLMRVEKSMTVEPGKILSKDDLVKFYQIMSYVFIIGGMLNFASQYFFYQTHPNLNSVLIFSSFFFIVGIILQIIQRTQIKADHQEIVFIILVSVSIPLITMKFIESASITVWVVPFIFLMLSVLFNKKRIILVLGIIILVTQIVVWIKLPTVMVQIDSSDYLARIGIFSIALWLAYYINRIYIHRLKENEDQIRFQKMVSQISTDFVKVTESNLDEKINSILQLIGEYFQVDRTFIISLSQNLKTYEWHNEGIEPAIDFVPTLVVDTFPWWANKIQNNDLINIPNVEILPSEAGKEKALLKQHNIQSLLSIPVTNKGKILGILLFASMKETKTWRGNHQELLKILANLISDAMVKVEAEKEIRYMAYYDALTGLPNHTLFKNRLEQAIHLAKRTENLIGVFFIDLDSFKSVNDTIGHLGGDELLKQVASRLYGCLRKQDTVSRFGGDEFLIQLTQITKEEDILKVADKIMKSFDKPVTVKDQEFFITTSAGIAVYPVDGEEADELIKNADLAMYNSKENGKNQYTLCSQDMKEGVLKKMKLTNSLYRAQERNELVLYYQPLISVSTKEIIGFEALIRWIHPDLGMISPATFIPLAEQTSLINPISQWVLKTACIQNKLWQNMGLPPARMAVNLSAELFRDPNIISIISSTLSETGLESKYLELEITESTTVKETDYIIEVLHDLKKLGVTIAIDDFGTEYSSLSRLKTLPVDRIKIDKLFVQGISEGNKDDAIAKTIIQLAKNLKLKVIAEGVETEQQFEFFSKQMCDEIQGFYFYKPMPAEDLETILVDQFKKK